MVAKLNAETIFSDVVEIHAKNASYMYVYTAFYVQGVGDGDRDVSKCLVRSYSANIQTVLHPPLSIPG